jgi:dTMP kinase
MKKLKKGVFITVEGGDGAGKSTFIKNLVEYFISNFEIQPYLTREPGGTEISEKIRALILDPAHKMHPLTELFLYEAARTEHVEKVIRPKLKENELIICDRFIHSSLAFQGEARNLGFELVANLNAIATSNLNPDLVIWLKLDPKIAKERIKNRSETPNRLDLEDNNFHEKVAQGFLKAYEREKERFLILDATLDPKSLLKSCINSDIFKDKILKYI